MGGFYISGYFIVFLSVYSLFVTFINPCIELLEENVHIPSAYNNVVYICRKKSRAQN